MGGASGSFRGNVSYYPASVIKTFYLAYYEAGKEAGTLRDTPELTRAVKDMITVSSNDATGFVVDSITGTTSGPELSGAEWDRWKERRNAVNRFFAKRGYRDLNANQKTFCEDAYGREQAFRDGGKNRNRMTPNEIVRLFREIARGEVAGPNGTKEMLALLTRDVTSDKPLSERELEDARLAGHALPAGTRMWAKSGDAYDFHHLVAAHRPSGGARLRHRGLHAGRQDGAGRDPPDLRAGRRPLRRGGADAPSLGRVRTGGRLRRRTSRC